MNRRGGIELFADFVFTEDRELSRSTGKSEQVVAALVARRADEGVERFEVARRPRRSASAVASASDSFAPGGHAFAAQTTNAVTLRSFST